MHNSVRENLRGSNGKRPFILMLPDRSIAGLPGTRGVNTPPPTAARVSEHSFSVWTRVHGLCPAAHYLLGIKTNDAMKCALALLFLVLTQPIIKAQNLVSNGSFEEYTECPDYFGQWPRVVGWTSPFLLSADYFNRCAGGVVCSVPFNQFGYQEPAHGNAYMGLATYQIDAALGREMIATELSELLVPGVPVYVSYKVTTGGFGSLAFNSADHVAKGPDLQFFEELPTDWYQYLFPNNASIEMQEVVQDTLAWVTVSGAYTPDAPMRWILIANLFEDSLSSVGVLDSGGQFGNAYVFVDDVCISYDPDYCQGAFTMSENSVRAALHVHPFYNGSIVIERAGGGLKRLELELVDYAGRLVTRGVLPSGVQRYEWVLPPTCTGAYLLLANSPDGTSSATRLVRILD